MTEPYKQRDMPAVVLAHWIGRPIAKIPTRSATYGAAYRCRADEAGE
jgi:hypothetical protein